VRISVLSLGYVGSVSAGCLTSLGHGVIGVDVSPMKSEVIVLGNQAPEFASVLQQMRPGQVVIDLVRISNDIHGLSSESCQPHPE